MVTSDNRKKALLLHLAGESVFNVYDTLKAEDDDYECCKRKLTEFYAPQVNEQFAVFEFRRTKQETSETLVLYQRTAASQILIKKSMHRSYKVASVTLREELANISRAARFRKESRELDTTVSRHRC